MTRRHRQMRLLIAPGPLALLAILLVSQAPLAHAVDVSPPPILQWFESSYKTIENRMPDLFQAGYGAVWTPPPFRADTGDQSVGYDVYDRFDLGKPGRPTLYGTETGVKQMANMLHRTGMDWHPDFVMNHNGYSTLGLQGFYDAGGYPGLAITLPSEYGQFAVDGDFHGAFWGGPEYERLAGLIDVALERNYQFIRTPVNPNDSRNIRAGTVEQFGRLANVADPNNAQYYPDIGHNTIYVFDPKTGEQNIPVHQFNLENPLYGDATPENAMGYMMRNAQWLVQVIGADGLRIDAAKHVQGFTLDYLDRAVYRANPRNLLDGSQKNVFSYSEVYDANPAVLLPHVKKDINPNDPGRIGGNRDTMDFKLYFAMKENLEHYYDPFFGASHDNRFAWYDIRNASLDFSDDGLHNGSAGVSFVRSHDVHQPYQLENVAQAYTLLMPGNTVVYFNGKEFGDNREFPKDGRSDAMSVGNGSLTTKLVEVRESHGRGNYAERWVDDQGTFVFERISSMVVGLSNRADWGYDEREVQVGFAPGTHLLELTGNAADSFVDPNNDIFEVTTVYNRDGVNYAKIRIPRNFNANGQEHGRGYVAYGLATPHSDAGLELRGTSGILAGDTTINSSYENGVTRQSEVHVVTGDWFDARLLTREVRLLGSDSLRDIYADGDYAAIKVDGGIDVNGNGYVDMTAPGSTTYGFENFGTKNSPLIGRFGINQPQGDINAPRGDGEFVQSINAANLSEGYHFIEARAFRLRTDGGPAVFTSWKESIYVDRLKPISGVDSAHPFGGDGNNDIWFKSLDMTAKDMHVFVNLPANLDDNAIRQMTFNGEGRVDQLDRDLFKGGYLGLPDGNNVFTIVTFEVTGNSNVQRITGQRFESNRGGGLGDLNFDQFRDPGDIAGTNYGFEHVLYSQNSLFNPAADIDGNGLIDTWDLLGLRDALIVGTAPTSSLLEWAGVMFRRVNFYGDDTLDGLDLSLLRSNFGLTSGPNLWTFDLNVDGVVDLQDELLMIGAFGVVPEPSSALLALIAAMGLVRLRGRAQARNQRIA